MYALLQEAAAETIGSPLKFALEVGQFVLLLLFIKWVAIGFRGKTGVVVNMLQERRERVSMQLKQAKASEEYLANARGRSETALREASEEAARLVAEAKDRAQREVDDAVASAREESDGMRLHARETLDTEFKEMTEAVRNQLVDLVSSATRQILNEGLSPAEQRLLIQRSILAGVGAGEQAETSEVT